MSVLGKIWSLADADQDTKLNQVEFGVAMHLINRALAGESLPEQLPASLAESLRAGGVDDDEGELTSANTGAASEAPGGTGALISAELRANYDSIFAQADSDKDGFVTGMEARDLFGRSG